MLRLRASQRYSYAKKKADDTTKSDSKFMKSMYGRVITDKYDR